MIEIPDADTLLKGPLGAWLEGQADERAKAREQSVRLFIYGGIAAAAAWVLVPLLTGWDSWFVPLAALMAFVIWGAHKRAQMTKRIKQGVNEALADALGIHFSCDADPGREFDLARTFKQLPHHNRKSFEDCWWGELGGTSFRMFEAHLQEKRGSGKNTHYVTVFRGIILRLAFAREFHGTTVIQRQRMRISLFGGDTQKLGGVRLDRMKMVDPRFEDKFDVYGSDPVEARYLVHPAYCERLMRLEAQFHGKGLTALFHEGDVIVTIPSSDLFESGSLDAGKDRAKLMETIEQFRRIAELMVTLNERPRHEVLEAGGAAAEPPAPGDRPHIASTLHPHALR